MIRVGAPWRGGTPSSARSAAGFAAQLLADAGGKREHPTYRAFFPDALSELIRLGLESQVTASARLHQVAKELKLSKASQARLSELAGVEAEAVPALKAREAAALARTRVTLRVQGWRENANAARRSAHTALQDHANRHGLPRDYAEAFFPVVKPSKKR